MTHIFGFERSQLLLLPETVDDYVGADNPVRFIDAFVDQTVFSRICFFWSLELALPQRTRLHHHEEDGNQNQDVYRGGNHAPDNRRGDGFHHVRPHTGLPQDRHKARQNGRDGHQFGTQALDGAFDGGLLNIDALQDRPGGKLPVKRFVQIDDHNDASLDRDSKQRDVTNPDRNTEIVAKVPLEKKASRHRIERRKDQNECFGHGSEHHVQQQKNRNEDDRQHDLQPLLGAQFEFIFARPLQAVAGRQLELFTEELVSPGDEAAIVPGV